MLTDTKEKELKAIRRKREAEGPRISNVQKDREVRRGLIGRKGAGGGGEGRV